MDSAEVISIASDDSHGPNDTVTDSDIQILSTSHAPIIDILEEVEEIGDIPDEEDGLQIIDERILSNRQTNLNDLDDYLLQRNIASQLFANLGRRFRLSAPGPSDNYFEGTDLEDVRRQMDEAAEFDETLREINHLRRTANDQPSHFRNNRRAGTRRRRREGNHGRIVRDEYRNTLEQIMNHSQNLIFNDHNEIENSIMQRIERDNDLRVDSRLADEKVYNKKTQTNLQQVPKNELPGYTNNIKENVDTCCELCGAVLGDGIPEDFKPDKRYNADLEKYISIYRVNAPWFCIKQVTPADIDLSKRIFRLKCGHVFCGRCVRNIGNKPKKTKANLGISIDNPLYYAPRRCPAIDCKQPFNSKAFLEAYF